MSDTTAETLKVDEDLVDKIAAAEREAAKQVQPPPPSAPVDPCSVPPPLWFDSLIARLFFLYPGASIPQQIVPIWWWHLGGIPPQVLAQAFARAPAEVPPQVVPSAELVRRVALQVMAEQHPPGQNYPGNTPG